MKKRSLIFTVLSTLLLGFVLGFFSSGRMTHARMARQHKFMKSPIAQKNHLAKKLDLTDKQMQQISPILETMLPKQIELFKTHRGQMDALRDSMFTSITPFLDATQLAELNKMKRRTGPGGPQR
ncbi:MAG: Spy/CpxP family protein refolding chaperone [Pseudoalteromonas distincta]|jgi:Spy/CpxP family protein refolding chaperone